MAISVGQEKIRNQKIIKLKVWHLFFKIDLKHTGHVQEKYQFLQGYTKKLSNFGTPLCTHIEHTYPQCIVRSIPLLAPASMPVGPFRLSTQPIQDMYSC